MDIRVQFESDWREHFTYEGSDGSLIQYDNLDISDFHIGYLWDGIINSVEIQNPSHPVDLSQMLSKFKFLFV